MCSFQEPNQTAHLSGFEKTHLVHDVTLREVRQVRGEDRDMSWGEGLLCHAFVGRDLGSRHWLGRLANPCKVKADSKNECLGATQDFIHHQDFNRFLTPSLPQPVKLQGWNACKQYIFQSYVKELYF